MNPFALRRFALLICGFDLAGGYSVLTLAGDRSAAWRDGVGTNSAFNAPRSLAFDSVGNLMVADTSNHREYL